MAHEFKAGDLALVVGSSKGISPNIGRAVELVRRISKDEHFELPDGRRAVNRGPECWLCEANGVRCKLYNGGTQDLGGVMLAMEIYLMPLHGDFQPERQKAKEAEPCA